MERNERRRADTLDRYWDTVQRGETPRGEDVDDVAAAVVRHLGEGRSAADLEAVHRRVRRRITGHTRTPEETQLGSAPVAPALGGPLPPAWPSPAESPRGLTRTHRLPWLAAQLATAILLLVAVGLGFMTFGPGRLHLNPPIGLPAPVFEPTIETLFATTLTAGRAPTEGNLHFVLWRLALAPGDGFPAWTSGQACCRGPQFTHLLEGELTVLVTGPVEVVRGADDAAAVLRPSPGEEVVVGPGDTIVHDFAFPAGYTVRGTRPVQILNAGLFAGSVPSPWLRHSGYLGGSAETLDRQLPSGPMSVRLLRAVLPPHAVTPVPPAGSLVLETGAADDANVGKRADGALFNLGDTSETTYAVVFEPSGKPSLSP